MITRTSRRHPVDPGVDEDAHIRRVSRVGQETHAGAARLSRSSRQVGRSSEDMCPQRMKSWKVEDSSDTVSGKLRSMPGKEPRRLRKHQ